MLAAYINALERILGVPAGTLKLVDESVLRGVVRMTGATRSAA